MASSPPPKAAPRATGPVAAKVAAPQATAPSPSKALPPRQDEGIKVRVWDMPTRLIHWLLVPALAAMFVTGQLSGRWMKWHLLLGLVVLALVLLRLAWGFVGGRWSRFTSFNCGPAAIRRYWKGKPLAKDYFHVGHNPLGAWAALVMLGLLLLQVGSGLVADNEISHYGPLARRVSLGLAQLGTFWHNGPGKLALLVMVVVHVLTLIYQRVRHKNNLLLPMITGNKWLARAAPASKDNLLTFALALALLVAFGALAAWLRTFR